MIHFSCWINHNRSKWRVYEAFFFLIRPFVLFKWSVKHVLFLICNRNSICYCLKALLASLGIKQACFYANRFKTYVSLSANEIFPPCCPKLKFSMFLSSFSRQNTVFNLSSRSTYKDINLYHPQSTHGTKSEMFPHRHVSSWIHPIYTVNMFNLATNRAGNG